MISSRLKWRLLVIVLLAVTSSATAVQSEDVFRLPDTRAGQIARAYFDSFNSGDPETMKAFETEYRSAGALEKRPVDKRVTQRLGLRDQTGVMEPAKVVTENPNSLVLAVYATKAEMWLQCTFTIEEEAPYKLVSVAIMPGQAPDAEASYVEEWKDLADLLGQIREKTGAPALAAAIVVQGSITDLAVVGERWVGSGQSAEGDDLFHIGSITKSMTATMIGALVQRELLSWTLTIGDLLPEMEMRDAYRGVTLEEILEHRGGFPSYTNVDDAEAKRLAAFPGNPALQREAFVAELLMTEPEVTPGTKMHYSNAGYAVVAYIAERVSARSWEELMRTEVFEACGMKTAGFGWPSTPDRPDQPRGHYKTGAGLRPQVFGEYDLGPCIAPAGDVNCSIGDLGVYAVVHLRGLAGHDRVFDAEIIQRLHTAPPVDGDEMRYAAGWAIVESPEVGEVHTHSGSAGTFFATIELYPEYETAVVLATNAGLEIGTGISQEITDLVKARIKERR